MKKIIKRFTMNARVLIITVVTAALLGYASVANAGVNYWTPVGPEGGNVTSLAIDPAMPSTVYAGTLGGVFKSINRGSNWSAVNSGLMNLQVSTVVIDPLNSAVIYAGTAGGIFKSTNGGMFWQVMNNGLAVTNTISLSIDPVTTTTIYAGTKNGLFKSTNGGANWFPTSLTNTSVIALAIDPLRPSTIYAVQMGMSRDILKSVDGGMSWSSINNNIPSGIAVTSVAVDPVSPTTIYAGGPNVIFKSTNEGATWQFFSLPAGPYYHDIQSIAVDPVSPLTVYAIVSGVGGYKSINGGTTWSPLNLVLTSGHIVVDPLMPSIVYAGGLEGIFGSIDGGTNWDAMNTGIKSMVVYSVAVAPVSSSVIYAGTLNRGIYKSTDQGADWNAISSGLTNAGKNLYVNTIVIDPVTPSTVYAGTYGVGGGIYKSTDGGINWNISNIGLSGIYFYSIAIDPVTPSTVYAGAQDGAFKSTDGGASWQAVNYGLTDQYQLPLSLYSLALDPITPSTIYAGTDRGVYKSTDNGASWNASNTGIIYYAVINALAIDPITPSITYAGTSAGAYKSTDNGANWQAVNYGLTNLQVNALAIDPSIPSTIYAGTSQGVFKSTDGGDSWQLFSDGLTNLWVKVLAIDPVDPSTVYAGTYGSGVFSITQGAQCTLAVQITGTGSGVVTSSPSGIDCSGGGSCSQVFKCSTSVSLSAASNADAIFTGWSGDADCVDGMVTMDSDKTCIANFAVRDTTPPVISGTPANIVSEATSSAGAVVTYTLPTAVDAVDGAVPISCSSASGSMFPLGSTTVTCQASDKAGNKATSSFTVSVKDTTAPVIAAHTDVTAMAMSSFAIVNYDLPTATDLVDGSVPVSCVPASGSTFNVGTTLVNCSATDGHGNTAHSAFNVNVTQSYNWTGFYQPVDNLPTVNAVKAGGAVPVKFSLSGYQGLDIMAIGSPTSVPMTCDSTATTDDITDTITAGSSSLTYDAATAQYIYAWKTEKAWAGTCRQLRLSLKDGSVHVANFKFIN